MVVEFCSEGIEILADETRNPPKFYRVGWQDEDDTLAFMLQDEKFRREYKYQRKLSIVETDRIWFEAKKQRLIGKYPEKYVAIYRGTPIAVGDTILEVAKWFYEQFGDTPVYIEQLSEKEDEAHINAVAA